MGRIHLMDEILSNKIAAGEVVEKCVSVVKELVENSIDANANIIKIELIDAGTKQIKVTDNGIGMDKEDAYLAFQRHATSKLLDEDDLYRIDTLGFRGEALPSIASVSIITLETCASDVGIKLYFKGGKLEKEELSQASRGTIITVDNLFFNTPARLKHLNSLNAELSNIVSYINKIALSYENIKFELYNNDRCLLNTSGDGNLLKIINEIYGIEVAKNMIEISSENEDYNIYGYISKPVINRSTRNTITTFVNGRIIRNNELNNTILDAYHTYIPEKKFPIIILKIEVDPSLVDVNIHPTKMDIKFSKKDVLKDMIKKTIKEKLEQNNLIPIVEDTISKMPEMDNTINVQQTLNLERVTIDDAIDNILDNTLKEDTVDYEKINNNIKENTTIDNAPKQKLEEMYVAGNVFGTYIICQNNTGMYLIDQHAAKERVNYEKVSYMLAHPTKDKVDMLIPISIELPVNEFLIIKDNMKILTDLNFDIEEFGVNSYIIKSHPIWLPKNNEHESIKRIFDLIIDIKDNFNLEKFNDSLAKTMSCKMSIKANDSISIEEMEKVIDDLRLCENPNTCPHGRPTIIKFTTYELEKMFKRSM